MKVVVITVIALLLSGAAYLGAHEAGKSGRTSGKRSGSAAAKVAIDADNEIRDKRACDSGNLTRGDRRVNAQRTNEAGRRRTDELLAIRDCEIFVTYGAVTRLTLDQEHKFLRFVKLGRDPIVKAGKVVDYDKPPLTTNVQYLRDCKCKRKGRLGDSQP